MSDLRAALAAQAQRGERGLVQDLLVRLKDNLEGSIGGDNPVIRKAQFRTAVSLGNAVHEVIGDMHIVGMQSLHEYAFRSIIDEIVNDLSSMNSLGYGSPGFNDAYRDAYARVDLILSKLALYDFVHFPSRVA